MTEDKYLLVMVLKKGQPYRDLLHVMCKAEFLQLNGVDKMFFQKGLFKQEVRATYCTLEKGKMWAAVYAIYETDTSETEMTSKAMFLNSNLNKYLASSQDVASALTGYEEFINVYDFRLCKGYKPKACGSEFQKC